MKVAAQCVSLLWNFEINEEKKDAAVSSVKGSCGMLKMKVFWIAYQVIVDRLRIIIMVIAIPIDQYCIC